MTTTKKQTPAIGTEVYYTGNRCNAACFGRVASVGDGWLGIELEDEQYAGGPTYLPTGMLVECTEHNATHASCVFIGAEYRAVQEKRYAAFLASMEASRVFVS